MKSPLWLSSVLLVLCLGIPLTAHGESTPSLIKDIRGGPEGSTPTSMAALGPTLLFQAVDAENGAELWKSDGTEEGTVLVKDIQAGPYHSSPSLLTTVGPVLYFTADDGVNGTELWKSDGTEEGTVLVKDINPAPTLGSSPDNLTALGATLYFTADDGTHGAELWKSDGTADGTVMVQDIYPGADSGSMGPLAAVGSILYLQATDQPNNHELWKSDGTPEGTVLVKDINPGLDASSSPGNLTAVGEALFFAADDGVNGTELWKSDGTADGTVMVIDIATLPPYSSTPYELRAVGPTLYFFAFDSTHSYALWKSDGTADGTVLVKDIDGTDYADSLTVAGSLLFFRGSDETHGAELWKSDGTESGTVMVKDINPALSGDKGSYPASLTVQGSTLYFSARTETYGTELWKSDGTESGTVLVQDINPGADDAYPESLFALGPKLFFNAMDGLNGVELWGIAPDDTAPTGTIVINNNRSATSSTEVTLSLTWDDGAGSGVIRMRFSDDGAHWTPWESPTATRAYTLPTGDGHKTVRVQYRDGAGNTSASFRDYIRLDTLPPTGTIIINEGATRTTDPMVSLSLTWDDGAGSQVSRMRFSDNGATWTAWEPPQATVQHLLPLPPGGYQTVRVQFRDGAGNVSVRYSDYIRLDTE